MPTLHIIFNDMSSLGRFFSRLRFKLSFISIYSYYMSAFSTLRASKSDDLFFLNKIVIASRAWRSHSVSLITRDCRCRFSPRNDICFVAAQSRWITTSSRAIEESVVISSFSATSMRLSHSLRSSQQNLQQPRLVNNLGW
jgi:hypothetical protein